MNICDFGHDEICYAGRDCPACWVKDELSSEILTLKEEIEDLKGKETAVEPV